ncbi:hypothetical protein VIGAN_04290900, partial [Vigna angularis var. angularis]
VLDVNFGEQPCQKMAIKYHFLICKILADIIERCPHCVQSEPTSVGTRPVCQRARITHTCVRTKCSCVLTCLNALHHPHTSGQFSQPVQAESDVSDYAKRK